MNALVAILIVWVLLSLPAALLFARMIRPAGRTTGSAPGRHRSGAATPMRR
ncbi:hypothetical protein VMT65_08960 [Nocardia sp. CDC153]|uniref:hypothetical protein n=1 Tax=Nocardia sp. CDC153 TaxID=3112167 RepID=UPI002DB7372C|nr:hypothetical protein [Nocardia sp. CDC153]MEC3953154.1 hypothetical protein [Nocardia sp. CDC153]